MAYSMTFYAPAGAGYDPSPLLSTYSYWYISLCLASFAAKTTSRENGNAANNR